LTVKYNSKNAGLLCLGQIWTNSTVGFKNVCKNVNQHAVGFVI